MGREQMIYLCQKLAREIFGEHAMVLTNSYNYPKVYVAEIINGETQPMLVGWMIPSQLHIYLLGVQSGLSMAKVLNKVPKAKDMMIVIKSDNGCVYEPNVNMQLSQLVEEYISGLCLDEPNDKECADWLNRLMEGNETSAKMAMNFIAEVWGMEVELKSVEIASQ